MAVLGGCNTMINKSYQKVKVLTPGVDGVECNIFNDKRHYRAVTPAVVLMERTPEKLKVECKKAYYHDHEQWIDSKLSMWGSTLNVANGVVPGTAYDVASRSIWEYPEVIAIDMQWDEEAYAAQQSEFAAPPSEVQRKPVPEAEPMEPAAPGIDGDKAFDRGLKK